MRNAGTVLYVAGAIAALSGNQRRTIRSWSISGTESLAYY